MGQQIVKQPNGLYAIWSSVVDSFTLYDATRGEIIEELVSDETRRITEMVDRVIADLNANGSPYFQFKKSFDECVSEMRAVHGDEYTSEIVDSMDKTSAAEQIT